MGEIVIAVYKPKQGKLDDLLKVVKDHVPTLRKLGYATDRPSQVMLASDGTVVEVFEWTSQEAVDKAHSDPAVHKLWGQFGACSDIGTIAALPGADQPFPHFKPVNP